MQGILPLAQSWGKNNNDSPAGRKPPLLSHLFCSYQITRTTLPKSPVTEEITGQLVFLGTGTSHGVPTIGCGCSTCTSPNPKNRRTRCAVALGLPEGNLLIDTPPELRIQLLRERIGLIHALLYTHSHADHLFGLDDVRIFPCYLGHELPVYCEPTVERGIRRSFDYAFDPEVQSYPAGGLPKLVFRPIGLEPFSILGAQITPLRMIHGRYHVLGFRVGKVAYCTDTKIIPHESMEQLQGLDVLILDCLRHEPHPTHLSIAEALAVVKELAPKRTLLTHISHHLEHETTNRELPPGVQLAYDGLRIPLEAPIESL
jgi:phosphoribosyl 1,2-cyclic phosphate phosphodiesterase